MKQNTSYCSGDGKENTFFFLLVKYVNYMLGVCQYGNKCLNLLARALKTSGSSTFSGIKPPAVTSAFTVFCIIYYF